MRCEELDELIEARADGEPLAPGAETHLAGCGRCQARLDLATAIDRLLLAREVPAPPDGFTMQVLRRVGQERWRVEQFVDAGFNLALATGLLIVLGGLTGLLWSLGWLVIDLSALSAAVVTVAPWTTGLAAQAQTVALAAALLSSALALWWWMEGGEAL